MRRLTDVYFILQSVSRGNGGSNVAGVESYEAMALASVMSDIIAPYYSTEAKGVAGSQDEVISQLNSIEYLAIMS